MGHYVGRVHRTVWETSKTIRPITRLSPIIVLLYLLINGAVSNRITLSSKRE